jgi:hypothetical protein
VLLTSFELGDIEDINKSLFSTLQQLGKLKYKQKFNAFLFI